MHSGGFCYARLLVTGLYVWVRACVCFDVYLCRLSPVWFCPPSEECLSSPASVEVSRLLEKIIKKVDPWCCRLASAIINLPGQKHWHILTWMKRSKIKSVSFWQHLTLYCSLVFTPAFMLETITYNQFSSSLSADVCSVKRNECMIHLFPYIAPCARSDVRRVTEAG